MKKFEPKGITKEKENIVENLAESFKNSPSVSFVDYTGLTVKAQQDLKEKLSEAGGRMSVAKNTMIRLAGEKAGFEEQFSEDVFSGQTAIIEATDDPVFPIQVLGKYIDENNIMDFKAGVIEGDFIDKETLVKISKLPSKEQLYANTVGTIGAPLYGLLGTLQGNLQKLLYVLQNAKGGVN
jgi:large subunit ribosomal protein L10